MLLSYFFSPVIVRWHATQLKLNFEADTIAQNDVLSFADAIKEKQEMNTFAYYKKYLVLIIDIGLEKLIQYGKSCHVVL
ncbi:MAG TPA: hypothetical protein VF411_02240 [Bacteroidia bacterium]